MPVVHLIAGPNGAGKTTFYERILTPATHLPFINADLIAKALWPGHEEAHGYDASRLAETRRRETLEQRQSFIAETVFSHPSKLDFIREAKAAGYLVYLHVILVPEELTVVRARLRVEQGGHSVPEEKVRARFQRLWTHVVDAISLADEAVVYDNTRADRPFREVAHYADGAVIGAPKWPRWCPAELRRQPR